MKFCALLLLTVFASAVPNDDQNENTSGVISAETPRIDSEPDKKEMKTDKTTVENPEEKEEIVVSKDNVVPILRTIILAFTHKKDPTYKEILKTGGNQLFKLAEKKVGKDKHMRGLLNMIKKHAQDYTYVGVTEEEEDVLAELAEEYLKKHKFKLLFPESLLLHQPEIEQVVAKKRELGELEGRQLKFDFSPYLSRLSNFTLQVRDRIQQLPIFSNLNLERIGTTLTSIGNSFDEYIPALRTGTGLPDLGISMGSLTALAAAGALLSAPFFMRSFGASAREDDEEVVYTNRRVGTGGFPGEQLLVETPGGKPGTIKRPEWIDEMENRKKVYSPKVNPQYNEPSFGPHVPQTTFNPNTAGDDEAYNKYLKEYNEWLEQYHKAVHLQKGPNKEYDDYYKKYREWYAKYYKEQFGESPPQKHYLAPNAYSENNNIPNMLPPPGLQGSSPQLQTLRNGQTNVGQQQKPQHPEVGEKESSNFQVIYVDENDNRNQYQSPEVEDLIPQGSALIESSQPQTMPENNFIKYQYANPRPVYRPTQQPFNPSTESGFKPLSEERNVEHKVFIFEKGEEEKENFDEEPVKSKNAEDDRFSGFSSIKSISIFKPPEDKLKAKNSKPKVESPKNPAPKISPVTSGVFRTTPKSTPRFESTPAPVYKRPSNKSVRVVTSTSVVTSAPFVKKPNEVTEEKKKNKKKVSLTELLRKNQPTAVNRKSIAAPVAEERIDRNIINHGELFPQKQVSNLPKKSGSDEGDSVPVYALDPFYGPRLSRTDAIFHQLSLDDESCREQVVCNMYKNPDAFTPLSDFLSRQLTVTYEQLKRPSVNDERILRFFRYLQAARAGQDGFNCLESYPNCDTDTTKLSYKPIVNAYKKVSVLMNASGAS